MSHTKYSILGYDKSYFVEIELQDKITLWITRALLRAGGLKKFFDKDRFDDDNVASFLNFDEADEDHIELGDVKARLEETLALLELSKKSFAHPILEKNLKRLSSLLKLNIYEKQILEFAIVLHYNDVLQRAMNLLGKELTSNQTKKILATMLKIPLLEINRALEPNGVFSKTMILQLEDSNSYGIDRKFNIISNRFVEYMMTHDVSMDVIFKNYIRPCSEKTLDIRDYNHMDKDLDILFPYLIDTLESKKTGVNILFYGRAGTGKTELAKVLTSAINANLYEVSYADEDNNPIDGYQRVQAYKIAQNIIQEPYSVLMYDEAEDIFESHNGFFQQSRQKDKAWINRMLETNAVPTIWITNNINSIDNAIIRRFDIVCEVKVPNKIKRADIIQKSTNNLIDSDVVLQLASHEDIAPAIYTRAFDVVKTMHSSDKSQSYMHLINSTLKAQGYEEVGKNTKGILLPNNYDAKYINADTDLTKLTKGIFENPNARICLYGPAGTGKSAYGRYLADVLNKPVLLKKGSDLISKWVGESERNIADAFLEARRENAVLIFDEVDSFLMDRNEANQHWQITQVNELLVQMESFDGVFIATTNLIDNLDKASLRRFDLKLEFNYLKSQQAIDLFNSYAKELGLKRATKELQDKIKLLKLITPGDFAAIVRQNRFHPIKDTKDMLDRLKEELALKEDNSHKTMGFLRSEK